MRIYYTKPSLKNLTIGARIAFIRCLNHLTQDEFAEALGITGERPGKIVTRYEKNQRIPKQERLKEMAGILHINWEAIKEFSFEMPIDYIYYFIWLEELYPNYQIDLPAMNFYDGDKYIMEFIKEWNEMKQKRNNREISYEEYMFWKLNYMKKDVENDKKNKFRFDKKL